MRKYMANDLLALAAFIDLYAELIKNAYIRKLPNGKYRVFSEKGRNMGTYDSMSAAKKRLRQIEFFKHKKASKTIDMTNIDSISYSAIIRELNRYGDKEAMNNFLSIYKKCFDELVVLGEKYPSDCALPITIIKFKKIYDIKLPETIANDKKAP